MTREPRSVVDRAFEVALATEGRAPRDGLAHPFGLNASELRWRVSPDIWDELEAWVRENGYPIPPKNAHPTLLGRAIDIDEGLPPNSMLLEAR